jgi:hypothetical protein
VEEDEDGRRCGGWKEMWRMEGDVKDGRRCEGWKEMWRMDEEVEDGRRCGEM